MKTDFQLNYEEKVETKLAGYTAGSDSFGNYGCKTAIIPEYVSLKSVADSVYII